MTDLDDDRLELLERQLAERVTERVRPALFRLYATVGIAVIGALTFVSWDIVEDIKSDITTKITGNIEQDTDAKRAEINERVTETQVLAKLANRVIQRVEKQLDDFQPQAENLNETIEKVKILTVTSKNSVADSEVLQSLVSNVESLSSQLAKLAEQVGQLNTIAAAGGNVAVDEPTLTAEQRNALIATEQRNAIIQSVISDTKKVEQVLVEARDKTTVFFQFAGGSLVQARTLPVALVADGYVVPGVDREIGAAGKHEVRYFHDEDTTAAKRLASDTTRALRSLGYTEHIIPEIMAESFVSYRSKKPRPGVLELWLEIPPR